MQWMACGSEGNDTHLGGDRTKLSNPSDTLASLCWETEGEECGGWCFTCSRQDLVPDPALQPLPSHLAPEPGTRKITPSDPRKLLPQIRNRGCFK